MERLAVGERVVVRQHRDGGLLPQRYEVEGIGVEAIDVDREPYEREVDVAGREAGGLLVLLDAHGLERQVGAPLAPGAQPLRGSHPRDVAEPQRHGSPNSSSPPIGGTSEGIGYGVRVSQSQSMKPETAAKKLGILLEAAPEEFRSGVVTRDELSALQSDPPEWLQVLRREGPHPRTVVAAKLGISNSGLARAGIDESLTTAEIKALLAAPPAWLVQERATQAAVRAEKVRVTERDKERAARGRESGGGGGGAGV